jgi:hypothetical protein
MNSTELNAVLTRIESAKRVTTTLVEKTTAFANYVQAQMEELGVSSLLNGKYTLKTVRTSVGTRTDLYLKTDVDQGYDWLFVCLCAGRVDADRDSSYFWGDFNASFNYPNRDDILTFINDAQAILRALAEFDSQADTTAIDNVI